MDYTETDVLCTKHKLWKKGSLVLELVDYLLHKGYVFKEVVIGEPNNFIFADHYDEIRPLFQKRGFYGIRIKVIYNDAILEINSNTDGIDNVQYTIYATDEANYQHLKSELESIRSIIGPSSESFATISEFIQTHRKLRNITILVLIAISLYFLGIHVFLFNIIQILFSFSPFLFIYIAYLVFRRRR